MKFEFDSKHLTDGELETLIGLQVDVKVREKLQVEGNKQTQPVVDEPKPVKKPKKYKRGFRRKDYTVDEVRTIVNEYNRGISTKSIARRHRRTKTAVQNLLFKLKSGKVNSEVLKKSLQFINFEKKQKKKLLTEEELRAIITELKAGKDPVVVAKLVNRPKPTVYNVLRAIKTGYGLTEKMRKVLNNMK